MNISECNEVYNQLVSSLREKDLSWVVDQVNETLALGKPQSRKVKTYEERVERNQLPLFPGSSSSSEPTVYEYGKPTGPKADLTAILEYTPQERLILLLNAIEQAVVDTAAMEDIAVVHLEELAVNQGITGIVFVSEQEPQPRVILSRDTASKRNSSSHNLKHLLQQLRSSIDDHQY